jgi:hypothetical protein
MLNWMQQKPAGTMKRSMNSSQPWIAIPHHK